MRQSGRAQEISAFFKGALESISPNQARGRTVAVREVLDETARRLENEPPQFPEAELELRESVGRAYGNLGLFSVALPHLERAAELARAVHGPEHFETGSVLMSLAGVQYQVAPLDQTEATYTRALAIFEAGGHALEQSWVERNLARVYHRRGDLEQAEEHQLRSRQFLEQGRAPAEIVTRSQQRWAELSRERGDLERAEQLARECVTRWQAAEDRENEAEARELLGLILEGQYRYADARDELGRALASCVTLYGDEHPQTVLCRTELALSVLRGFGREAAAELVEGCFARRDVLLASRDSIAAQALVNLGTLAMIEGEYALAEELQRQALEQFDAIFEQDTYFEEAEQRARATLDVLGRLFGEGSPREASALGLLGWVDVGRGRWAEAIVHGRRALAGVESEPGSQAHIGALTNLGSFLYFAGQNDEALVHLELAVQLLRAFGLEPDARWARALNPWGEALRDGFRLEEAELVLREALELRRRFLGDQHADTAETMNALAMVLWYQQDLSSEAGDLWVGALEALRPMGVNHTYTAWVLNNLGAWFRVRENDLDKALQYVDEGVAHARRTAPANHPLLAINLANLANIRSSTLR